MTPEAYLAAREGLLRKDLIAAAGTRVQVLSLPAAPVAISRAACRRLSGDPLRTRLHPPQVAPEERLSGKKTQAEPCARGSNSALLGLPSAGCLAE